MPVPSTSRRSSTIVQHRTTTSGTSSSNGHNSSFTPKVGRFYDVSDVPVAHKDYITFVRERWTFGLFCAWCNDWRFLLNFDSSVSCLIKSTFKFDWEMAEMHFDHFINSSPLPQAKKRSHFSLVVILNVCFFLDEYSTLHRQSARLTSNRRPLF